MKSNVILSFKSRSDTFICYRKFIFVIIFGHTRKHLHLLLPSINAYIVFLTTPTISCNNAHNVSCRETLVSSSYFDRKRWLISIIYKYFKRQKNWGDVEIGCQINSCNIIFLIRNKIACTIVLCVIKIRPTCLNTKY